MVTQQRWFMLAALLFPLCGTALNPVYGEEFSLGVAGHLHFTPYNADHRQYSALPIIHYDNDIWYISANEAGWYLINSQEHELDLKVSYQGKKYDSDEGSTSAMRRLRDRRDTLMSGVSYQYTSPIGAFGVEVLADTLNHSKGASATLSYLNPVRFQDFSLVPSAKLTYDNGQQNRYFYGISSSESQRSGLRSYRPKEGFTPKLGLTVNYQITSQWGSYLDNQVDFLPSTVRNSPMVEHDISYGVTLGVNYRFK